MMKRDETRLDLRGRRRIEENEESEESKGEGKYRRELGGKALRERKKKARNSMVNLQAKWAATASVWLLEKKERKKE